MGESVVTFFLDKLSDLLLHEAAKLGGAAKQLKLLQDELEWMRLILEDAEATNRSKIDKRFNLFLNQIRDIIFDAEDVIDEFFFKLNRHPQENNSLLPGFACKGLMLRDLDARISDINARLDKLSTNKSRYGIDYVPSSLGASSSNRAPTVKERRVPVVEEVDVVGVEGDTAAVKGMLLSGVHGRVVVSIVGMGGIGKTTLAKKVYNDVQHHFPHRAWVYVSQDYGVKDLLVRIAKATMIHDSGFEEMEAAELRSKIHRFLKYKKYLIAMDDMWSTGAWDELHSCFPDSNNCSRILVTSRNKDVALYADPKSQPHELRFLDSTESWYLFVRKVFGVKSSTAACPMELVDLGKQIVGKCGGLPLAIVVLGGLLSRKERTRDSWRRVLDSINWHLSKGSDSCFAILALSYNDLSYYLKSCFLYCGTFPEDREIKASKLMHMWIAEGFIRSRGGRTVLEDIAEDNLEELVLRNMIQVIKRRSNGGVKSWRIHDLLRDLAISEARETIFFETYESVVFTSPIVIRRLIIHDSVHVKMTSQIPDNSKLRSLICFSNHFKDESCKILRAGVMLLTVLDLEGVYATHALPEQIHELIHLKFLGLRGTSTKKLPMSIGKLAKLQTLYIRDEDIQSLPTTIGELQQLRHFYSSRTFRCYPIRQRYEGFLRIGQLVNLQTYVGCWLGDGGLGTLTQLRKLQIGGELLQHSEVLFESLHKLTNLQSLYLHSIREGDYPPIIRDLKPFTNHAELYKMELTGRLESLPAAVEFYPPNLTKLALSWSLLDEDPMLTLEKLPNLRVLSLGIGSYNGKKMWCSPGGFPKLHSLSLINQGTLEEWDVDEGALPLLRYLSILACKRMKRIPNGLLRMQNLLELIIAKPTGQLEKQVKLMQEEDWVRKPSIVMHG